jgi:polysaccharide biosynthesis protein PslH
MPGLTQIPRRRVLVLANRLPWPIDDGWKTRTYHVIQGVLQHASVTLLIFHDGPASDVDAFRSAIGGDLAVVTVPPPRSRSPVRLLLGLVTSQPLYVWNWRSRRYRRQLFALAAEWKPDVVVAELTCMYQYARLLPRRVLRIVDTHNIDSVLLGRYAGRLRGRLHRWYAAVTARKLRAYEREVFTDADSVWVCSEAEELLVQDLAPGAGVQTIPNGVDTVRFSPRPDCVPRPRTLLFFGRMDYEPNRDAVHYFAREILPLLRRTQPDLELQVVGAGIDEDLRRLARGAPEIRLVGRVDDIMTALAAAELVVVPLRMGGGTRLKILEALSIGKPVVSTSAGAEGLRLTGGRDLLLADSPEEFAAAVNSVLADPALRERLGRAGRAAVHGRYDWGQIRNAVAAAVG